jgi:L-rhamnose isomerase
MSKNIIDAYKIAKEKYAKFSVDTDKVLETLKKIPVSIQCWQGDDIGGFEKEATSISGGILVTGNFPGKPRNIEEFRKDAEKSFSMIPGKKKFALHAMYGDYNWKLKERTDIEISHFKSWVDWAKKNSIGLDFNPTLFAHSFTEDGYTLAASNEKIRKYWVEHVIKSREICNYIGSELREVCFNNIWIPDGSKDITVTRFEHRQNLLKSLDEIFVKKYPEKNMQDSLECKLFGIGAESYTPGSLEFYLSYAVLHGLQVTLDTGHFHPTELISDKISAVLPFVKGVQLHLTRGIRWDSDHIPILVEEIIAIMQEIVRADAFQKVSIGLDYFDATMNRIGAWVIGARNIQKALLIALLEPTKLIRKYEEDKNYFARMAMLENLKFMPFADVWNFYCQTQGVAVDDKYIDEVLDYEKEVLRKR